MATQAVMTAPPEPNVAGQSVGISALWMALAGFEASTAVDRLHSARAILLIAAWMPLAIALIIAFGRRFLRWKQPERWPEGAQIARRLKTFAFTCAGSGVALALWTLAADISRGYHSPWSSWPHYATWLLIGWFWLLNAYILERKPVPPPSERQSIWPDIKPIRSEQWGGREGLPKPQQ